MKKMTKMVRQPHRRDFVLKAFLVIFIVGYTFFFISPYILPKVYHFDNVANVGESVSLDNYILTIDSWDFAKEDRAFELILDIENLTLNKNPKIDMICREGDKVYKAEIYKDIGDDKKVIRIKNVSRRWVEVIFTVTVDKKTINLYMNDKNVNTVAKLKDRSKKEYLIYAAESQIKGMESIISKIKENQLVTDKKMNEGYNKLEELQAKKDNKDQTAENKALIESNISSISTELENLKAKQDESFLEIENYEAQIAAKKKELEKLKN